ncbi:hypothetical protein LOAG_06108 [Loa loa]|uniref:Uncharacterized protein n=2 Tax=Loa loa TaxID=7209 RepID=A0A1S0TYL4_LOALO|nr:hypothetical protein LOAG_06108 [Loa loa]EFO22379.2 hypothetical protein LOAG_06108 [Loa loa]
MKGSLCHHLLSINENITTSCNSFMTCLLLLVASEPISQMLPLIQNIDRPNDTVTICTTRVDGPLVTGYPSLTGQQATQLHQNEAYYSEMAAFVTVGRKNVKITDL